MVLFAKEPQVIHGHQLPPEPDPLVNDSTLLGIDANGNGVRDDVEIWILNKYKDKHPIHIDIAMQVGRAWQKVLEDPSKAKETTKYMDSAQECEAYYYVYAKYFQKLILVQERINDGKFNFVVLNNQQRKEGYLIYDALLSGDIYHNSRAELLKNKCDFNTTKYED